MKIIGIVPLPALKEGDHLIFKKVKGRKIVDDVIQKIKRVDSLHSLILSTSRGEETDRYSQLAKKHQLKIFRGSDNLVERLKQIAQEEGATHLAVISPNMPLLDIPLTKDLIEKHCASHSHYSCGKGYPLGIIPEILSLSALSELPPNYRNPQFAPFFRGQKNSTITEISFPNDLERVDLSANSIRNLSVLKEIAGIISIQDANFQQILSTLPSLLASMIQKTHSIPEKRSLNRLLNDLESSLRVEGLLSMPPLLRIDAHNLCNLRCETCFQKFDSISSGKNEASGMDQDLIKKMTDLGIFYENEDNIFAKEKLPLTTEVFTKIGEYLFPYLETISFGAYGEAFLNKNIFHLIQEAKKIEGLKIHILTNGSLLNQNSINKLFQLEVDDLSISCDGASPETYENIRKGASFSQMVATLLTVKEIKKQEGKSIPRIELNFTAARKNIEELPALIELANTWGVSSLIVINRFILDFMDPQESLFFHRETAEKALMESKRRARELNIHLVISPLIQALMDKSIKRTQCDWPWNQVYLSSAGMAHLCSCGGLGSVNGIMDASFKEIWNHKKFKSLRRKFKNGRQDLLECQNCVIGSVIVKPDNKKSYMYCSK